MIGTPVGVPTHFKGGSLARALTSANADAVSEETCEVAIICVEVASTSRVGLTPNANLRSGQGGTSVREDVAEPAIIRI